MLEQEMPKGYGLMPRYYGRVGRPEKCTWYILKRDDNRYLKTYQKKTKYFRTPERAAAYARKHAELGLNYTQQVPNWN